MDISDALSKDFTIQSSESTLGVVDGVRTWVASGASEHCVIIGPPGSGRTHFLEAAASLLSSQSVGRLSPADSDWNRELSEGLKVGSFGLVDNVDKYDERFRKRLLSFATERKARVLATSEGFDGRLARLWEHTLGAPTVLRLAPLHERPQDIRDFLRRWLMERAAPEPLGDDFAETVELIASLRLQRGFVDLLALLQHLSSRGYVFSQPLHAPTWVNSYHQVLADSKPTLRVILVEGETDAIYFKWVADLALGAPDPDVSVESCGSATKVVERSIACRNEGRTVVALFDFDRMGRKHYEDLHGWGHKCAVLPSDFDPLKNGAPDHVLQVVEIEDLLPVASHERFYQDLHRKPEVEISLPVQGLKRLVPHADQKLELARWVAGTFGPVEAERFLKIYNHLRAQLSLPPLKFPSTRL